MKITITLDTEIPVSAASAHPKILLNNAYLDSLGIEGLRQASVGSLILLPAPESLLRGEYADNQKADEVRPNTQFF